MEKDSLKEKSISPRKITEEEEKKSLFKKINRLFLSFGGIPLKEKLFFVRHLTVMLKAGISLLVSLKTLSQQSKNKYFSLVLMEVADDVEKGKTMHESLRPYKKIFGELFINMVESGELSGKLEEILDRAYLQMKKQYELISKVKSALTYPIVIMTAMIGIAFFMMVFVVPKITNIFKEYGAELPLPTKILITVSETLSNNLAISFVLISILIFLIVKILKTEKGRYLSQSLLLKAPIFSPIIKKINMARFSRTMSSLLKTDIMIIKTLQITASVLGNLHYRKAIMETSEKIKKGGQINEILKDYPDLFPPIVIQMITVGEQTGELDDILEELADFYEDEVNRTMESLPSILEPLIILVLGCGVGLMAAAIIMPMYSLSDAI